ncbi:MAG TPA: c-type cytochrome [Steroidobacteraceae bacterium]|nr:c-type cytochrome [Steroidobacteraceae bacterium]
MRFRLGSGAWAAALTIGALASTFAAGQEPAQAGDPERGRALSYTCLGCHGVPNYKNAYPSYRVPKLAGQYPEYIVAALHAYKSGERSHATMHAQSASLSDQDMADIAAFFAHDPLKSDGKAEGQPPQAAEACVSCHGKDGVGLTPLYPTLAGQHADYLARALTDYKRGGRKNAIMAGFAGQLTTAQIEALSEYYATQKPALATLERSSRMSAAR